MKRIASLVVAVLVLLSLSTLGISKEKPGKGIPLSTPGTVYVIVAIPEEGKPYIVYKDGKTEGVIYTPKEKEGLVEFFTRVVKALELEGQ